MTLLGALTLTAGCSSADGTPQGTYDPRSRSRQEVEKEVGDLSSGALGLTRINGKVTEGGPAVSPCGTSEEKKGLRSVRHVWSVYGVDHDALGQGMRSLAVQLPANGWKVVKNGPNPHTKAKTPEVFAVHETTRTQLEASWMDGSDGGEELINFSVYSECFKDTDPE
ncbi:hypothetical protein CP980_19265 [Streptomyces vinaceus]|uniref:Lipoprotein n=2 Tax=Streptomyces vinaceus TaxID=1960 RepID=A0A5J6JBC3_STRVI|nr:hypothetical protein CP980_19265 [Streptomyces vinaceus]GHE58388.1 hypothetical protein GCM10017778_48410 [Streptomyces vinaceus]